MLGGCRPYQKGDALSSGGKRAAHQTANCARPENEERKWQEIQLLSVGFSQYRAVEECGGGRSEQRAH